MPLTAPVTDTQYDITQAEDDIATLQGQLSDMEEVMYLLLTAPQPPNTLADRVQMYANSSQNLPA